MEVAVDRFAPMGETSLYDEIGGRDAVEAVVDDFYDRVLDDDRLAGYFEGVAMGDLRAHQVAFVSAVAGGPAEYTGEDMRTAHAHLDIDDGDFDAVADHLEIALRENGLRGDHVAAIMREVAALRDPIVGR
jgi:hemoglobin